MVYILPFKAESIHVRKWHKYKDNLNKYKTSKMYLPASLHSNMRRLPSSSCLSWGFLTKEGATFSPVDPISQNALTAQSRDTPPQKPDKYFLWNDLSLFYSGEIFLGNHKKDIAVVKNLYGEQLLIQK